MLDRDLAELYGVETRVLKQAVNRNIIRFPAHFMFELSEDEIKNMVSQFVIPSKSYFAYERHLKATEFRHCKIQPAISDNGNKEF
jgi:hypothetical protein